MICRVNLRSRNERTGELNFINFRSLHPSIDALRDAVRRHGIVAGEKLRCRRRQGAPPRVFEVVARGNCTIRRAEVASIEPADIVIVDGEGGS